MEPLATSYPSHPSLHPDFLRSGAQHWQMNIKLAAGQFVVLEVVWQDGGSWEELMESQKKGLVGFEKRYNLIKLTPPPRTLPTSLWSPLAHTQ